MAKYWLLKDALYQIFHNWARMILFFAVGCLIGWGITFIIPVSYLATSHIYVALNPYRAYSDTVFQAISNPKYANVDDYKNWQMEQLESVIFLDDFINQTLHLLQEQDPYWESIDTETLRSMLDANWRSAGDWSLTASAKEPLHAEQASKAWAKISVSNVQKAIEASQNTVATDEELKAAADKKIYARMRIDELTKAQSGINTWKDKFQQMPPDKPVPPIEHWKLVAYVTNISTFDPAWLAILNQQPVGNAIPSDYIDWLETVQLTIQHEINTLENNIETLDQLQDSLTQTYSQESDNSLGLSPNLVVHGITSNAAQPKQMTNLYPLIGGFTGLLVWLFYELILVSKKAKNSEQIQQH